MNRAGPSKRTSLMAMAVAIAPTVLNAQTVSTYGTPGLLEIPTAEMFEDGTLAFTAAAFDKTLRTTMTFQMLPWVHGSFRYSVIDGFDGDIGSRYDRSFDLHFRLREESRLAPALVLGLRDFGGTGVYAAEYLVATKTYRDRFKLTGGIGWGRLAGRGSFSNPLGVFSKRFDKREDANAGGISETGQLDFGNWFQGDAAFFGGGSWQYNDRLTFMAEYSPDLYTQERNRVGFDVKSPINVGAQYKFRNGSQLTASYLYGTTFGVTYSYFIDPRKTVAPGGQGDAPPPLKAQGQVAAGQDHQDVRQGLQAALDQQGLRLVYLRNQGSTAQVGIENATYGQAAQAIGRTARVLANQEPAEIKDFDIALMSDGVPLSSVRVNRDDLYELEHDPDAAWRSFARANISDTV